MTAAGYRKRECILCGPQLHRHEQALQALPRHRAPVHRLQQTVQGHNVEVQALSSHQTAVRDMRPDVHQLRPPLRQVPRRQTAVRGVRAHLHRHGTALLQVQVPSREDLHPVRASLQRRQPAVCPMSGDRAHLRHLRLHLQGDRWINVQSVRGPIEGLQRLHPHVHWAWPQVHHLHQD